MTANARIAHLFVMDPVEALNLQLDSSLRLMRELTLLGHEVAMCEPRDLAWQGGEVAARGRCRTVTFGKDATEPKPGPAQERSLAAFAAVHMRKDPPYDLDYVGTTWLLDTVASTARVYNDPAALRRYNEKLAILQFPKDIRPALVSANAEAMLAFIEKEAAGDGIVKPLTLFGGRGVIRVTTLDGKREEALATLKKETDDGHALRLVQPFDRAVFDGEVRVFTAFGEPVAWCLKRPAGDNFLANTRAGATLEAYKPSATEVERVRRIAHELLRDGVVFLGFDLIGGYVSEINLTSPRLLTPPGDSSNYYKQLADMVADDLRRRAGNQK